MKKLSKEEMKMVSGGTPMLVVWMCQDVSGGPYNSTACSTTDPAGTPDCPEYSCYTNNVRCSLPSVTCS